MAPLSSSEWLTNLKSVQLKALAAAIGTNSSGPKPTLVAALQAHLPLGFFPRESKGGSGKRHDIISIDMGIRNLAYCRITLPASWPSSSHTHTASAAVEVPTISEWARIGVSPFQPPPKTSALKRSEEKKKSKKAKKNKEGEEKEEIEKEEEKKIPTPTPTTANPSIPPADTKEAFDPSTLSQYAYNFITHLLNQHPTTPPTQILIERQRFRSMGGSAVQEWTLRVNTFEAMLYAVLKTLSEEGRWAAGGGGVYPIAPAKVARFWLGEEEELGNGKGDKGNEDAAPAPSAGLEGEEEEEDTNQSQPKKPQTPQQKQKNAKQKKLAKIKIVERWLSEILSKQSRDPTTTPPKFRLEGQARQLGEAFLKKRKGVRDVKVRQKAMMIGGGAGGAADDELEEVVEVGKLDDLADCVLQGMAWVEWEENRLKVLEGGASVLEELS